MHGCVVSQLNSYEYSYNYSYNYSVIMSYTTRYTRVVVGGKVAAPTSGGGTGGSGGTVNAIVVFKKPGRFVHPGRIKNELIMQNPDVCHRLISKYMPIIKNSVNRRGLIYIRLIDSDDNTITGRF